MADKPQCAIDQGEDDGQIVLHCRSDANPNNVQFRWSRGPNLDKARLLTDESNIYSKGGHSQVFLDPVEESVGHYFCVANNSLGQGSPCQFHLAEHGEFYSM